MNSPRNFWPIGITLTLILFTAGTASLVVMAATNRVDLVSPDYYDQEIRFQEHIDRVKRTHEQGADARIGYDAARAVIAVALPAQQVGHLATGRIQLYRPAAEGLDRETEFRPDATGAQMVDAASLSSGPWKVRLSWTCERQDYFTEMKVVIPATDSSR